MTECNELLDFKLLGLLKGGSLSAFNTIYRIYAKRLLQYVSSATKNKEDAEEIVHDIFMSLWNNREKLDTSQKLSTLLFSIAYRRRIDFFRHMLSLPIYEDYQHCKSELITEDNHNIEYREFCEIFKKALDALPERPREVIKMSKLDGLSNNEISTKLNISEKTVRNISSNALKALNSILKRMLEIY